MEDIFILKNIRNAISMPAGFKDGPPFHNAVYTVYRTVKKTVHFVHAWSTNHCLKTSYTFNVIFLCAFMCFRNQEKSLCAF